MKYPKSYEIAYKALLTHLKILYDYYKSYQKVADYMGVTKGLIYKVMVRKHKPKKPDICVALGLPPIIEAPVLLCPQCGKIQVPDPCRCAFKKTPSMEKKPERIRVDIEAELLTDEQVEAIRNLDKAARTKFLALLAGYDIHEKADISNH